MQITQLLQEWRLKVNFAKCLRALTQLQHAYFACYLQRDYLARQSYYEKTLYQKRSLLLRRLASARCLLKRNKIVAHKWGTIFYKLEHGSEIIFSLHQLRFRVSGYAIFEICAAELQALEKTLRSILKNFVRFILCDKEVIYSEELLDKIHAFEAISHRTLQIASPEPLIFLFFIQDLYALHDEINGFS